MEYTVSYITVLHSQEPVFVDFQFSYVDLFLCFVKYAYSKHVYNEWMLIVKWISFSVGFKQYHEANEYDEVRL